MAPRAKKKTEGFWDTYKDEGGGKYLTAAEKNALIDAGTVLQITGVRYDEKNQFQGNPAPRYVVTFLIDGVERFAGFAISEDGDSSRDRLLAAILDYLDSGNADEKIEVVMEKIGQFVALVKA
jgi:hypothetical protein